MALDIYVAANEDKAMYASPEVIAVDKAVFITNLAGLLQQTREGIVDLALSKDGETVTVIFEGGGSRQVNIACDSYLAIVRDVTKAI